MTKQNVLITGGAGFVGSNLAHHFAGKGNKVVILDNLSRVGTEKNLGWLMQEVPSNIKFVKGDVRNFEDACEAVKDATVVYHLAAQVAVTTSVDDPRSDFDTNALGTFNVLEACRRKRVPPVVIYTSTNKVYGALPDLQVERRGKRYCFREGAQGVDETRPLDFHSPYGCSKGAADQYVRDYARIYNIPTVVFRMSCIYGPRQFGNEDQGWVAHFVISALKGAGLTIYGDGMQARDVLYVRDLVDAFEKAALRIERTAGQVYNIGGGPENVVSLAELMDLLEERLGREIPRNHSQWRPGDQKLYVSNVRKAERGFGWKPTVRVDEGVEKLIEWVRGSRELFPEVSLARRVASAA